MKPKDALLERWKSTVARKDDAPAIFNTAGEVLRTFRGIEEHARAVEAKVRSALAAAGKTRPVKLGNVIGIQIGNHHDWPSLFLTDLRRGQVVLPIDESVGKQQSDMAMSIAAKSGLIDWGNKLPAVFKLTSGTTAAPRLIRFRSEQLLADCEQICDTMGITDVDLNFGVIPISHSYGFSNLLTPLLVRGVPMAVSRDRTPRAVLVDLARTGATVFPGMPLFYQAFCEMETVPDLTKLRLCISAGPPLSIPIAKNFRDKFGLSIRPFYGASECGGICYDHDGTSDAEGFVGQPMKNVVLEILDPAA